MAHKSNAPIHCEAGPFPCGLRGRSLPDREAIKVAKRGVILRTTAAVGSASLAAPNRWRARSFNWEGGLAVEMRPVYPAANGRVHTP